MNLIHLQRCHRRVVRFKHPLLDDAKAYSEEDLTDLRGADLILALRSCLRHIVGLYLGNWPECKPHVDDMVSEGFVAITMFANDFSLDMLEGRPILKVVSHRIQDAIEVMLNKMQAIAAPSTSTQVRLLKQDKDPVYLAATSELVADSQEDPCGTYSNDVFDALEKIEAKDELDAALLSRPYWDKTEQEVADMFDVDQATVHRRKRRLYDQYLQLTR